MSDVIAKCPSCGGDLSRKRYVKDDVEKDFIGCSNYKEKDCKFTFSTSYFETKFSDETIKQLLEQGKTTKPVSIKVNFKMEDGKIKMDFIK